MDCVRTAVRQGRRASSASTGATGRTCPARSARWQNAEEEGVRFEWLTLPKGFVGEDRVTGVRVARMRLGAPDATGRQAPEEIPGADYTEDADLVIKALGFEPEDLPRLWGVEGLEVTRWGTIKADFRTKMTSLPGVYAVGDIVRGASLVVWAVRDGREAAESILEAFSVRAAGVAAE
jgi:glutamate synthase (NADPH) small chain